MERVRLECARFELEVADLVMKHIEKVKSSGVLHVEDRGEAAKKSANACSVNTLRSSSKPLRWLSLEMTMRAAI
jgi:hypothetical protein